MYQYSLDAFRATFQKAMATGSPAAGTQARVKSLRSAVRLVVYTWVARGLFERHKLIFSTMLCFKLMQKEVLEETCEPSHLEYLIRGPRELGHDKNLDWLPAANWAAVCALVRLPGFEKLGLEMEASPNRFREWSPPPSSPACTRGMLCAPQTGSRAGCLVARAAVCPVCRFTKARPEAAPLPLDWRRLDDTNPFMKLLVLRALRPDRISTAMHNYVERSRQGNT